MKKNIIKVMLICLVALTMIFASACANKTNNIDTVTFKVTFYDGDGKTVLKEVNVNNGDTVTIPKLTKDGYLIEGYYATPALMVPFDKNMPIIQDTAVFVAWQSSVQDTRKWMLAGALRGYPENAWGKIWPQDNFLLKSADGEFNTFSIDVNLYKGDAFKIAVIGEGYNWDKENSIDASHLADKSKDSALQGGENLFSSGANIEVKEDGKYRLILKTDAETLSLSTLSYEKLGKADKLNEIVYDMKLWASFNDWKGQDMIRNGDDFVWYVEADVPENGGEFGIKNVATEDWYSSENNTKNIKLDKGHYMFFIELEIVDGKPVMKGNILVEEPAYYIVGSCGNGGWAADANIQNTNYKMEEKNGLYEKTVTFTNEDVDKNTNKVGFKVAYGATGKVPNDKWFGDTNKSNFNVDVGTYTITLDPKTGIVTVK